jgi:integrase
VYFGQEALYKMLMARGIYKLPNGKYRWHLMIEGIRYHGIASNLKEAEQAKSQKLIEHRKGLVIAPNQVTFSNQLEGWLQSKVKTCSLRTVAGYRYIARKYIPEALLERKLNSLRPLQVKAIYDNLEARGLDTSTIRQTHIVIYGVLKMAVQNELIARNVAEGLKPHASNKDDARDLQILAPSEAIKFAATCKSHKWGSIFLFMLLTGTRRGEALGLTWANVNLDGKVPSIRIEHSVGNVEGKATITRPKTKSSRRVIYLCAEGAQVIRERLAIFEASYGFASKPSDFVFTNMSGSMIQPDHLKRHMDAICKQAQVPRVRIHDLRHTYASLALRAGNRIEVVSRQLGHSTITMTLDVYRHVYQDELQNVVGVMSQ